MRGTPVTRGGFASRVTVVSFLPRRVRLDLRAALDGQTLATDVAEALRLAFGPSAHVAWNPLTGRALIVFDAAVERSWVVETVAAALCPTAPALSASLAVSAPSSSGIRRRSSLPPETLRVIGGGVVTLAITVARLVFGAGVLASMPVVALAVAGATLVGLPTFVSGLRPLLRGCMPVIDTLIATATISSLLVGEAVTGLVIVWLIALGELVESLTIDRTRRAIADLLAVGDEWAWVVVGGEEAVLRARGGGASGAASSLPEVKVRLASLAVGDVVVVNAGQRIPVDGRVISGWASVNQASITGESMAVFRNPGDEVFAGTIIETGELLVVATRVAQDTTIGRIIRLVEEAREARAPIQRLADRFSRQFVPLSFLLAGGVFALTGNVLRSVTILVIACPCAAGLATPTAVSAAIARAARRGILIKGGAALEAAASIDAMVFDKTGTITDGAPRVRHVVPLAPDMTERTLLALASSGELHSQHPLASAILGHAEDEAIDIPPHGAYEIVVGHGVRFDVDGVALVIGSRHMLEDYHVPVAPTDDAAAESLRAEGLAVLWIAEAPTIGDRAPRHQHEVRAHPDEDCDAGDDRPTAEVAPSFGRVLGVIGVSDVVREGAMEALAAVRAAGVRHIEMVTGDSAERAMVVARALGFRDEDVHAAVLPETKAERVRALTAAGYRVGFAGDGVNDAPALSLATVGIAMGYQGADVAVEAAGIALANGDLALLAELMMLSRETMRLVRQNFAAAVGINGLGLALGAVGLLSPFAAALVHNLSTVAVVINSGRLLAGADRPLARGLRPKARALSNDSITADR
jgi:cation-transporting P-type ATPase C